MHVEKKDIPPTIKEASDEELAEMATGLCSLYDKLFIDNDLETVGKVDRAKLIEAATFAKAELVKRGFVLYQEGQDEPLQKSLAAAGIKEIPIFKQEEERFVLGIVLEPNDGEDGTPLDPDSQGDVYSKAEVRQTAHKFMAEFQNVGHMHRSLVNGRVIILQSFVVPEGTGGFDIVDPYGDKQHIREGTWLMGFGIVDDQLWQETKDDELTGLSIGGSGRRVEA